MKNNMVYVRKRNAKKAVVKHIVESILAVRELYKARSFQGLEFQVRWKGSRTLTWETEANLIEHGFESDLEKIMLNCAKHRACVIEI